MNSYDSIIINPKCEYRIITSMGMTASTLVEVSDSSGVVQFMKEIPAGSAKDPAYIRKLLGDKLTGQVEFSDEIRDSETCGGELEAEGYIVVAGRVARKRFEERCYGIT